MSAFESGLEARVLLVLGDELAFGQAFLLDMLREVVPIPRTGQLLTMLGPKENARCQGSLLLSSH